jgi:hypothetical protein
VRSRAVEAILWAVVFVAVAVAIAAGTRLVAWVVVGETEGVWRAAIAIVTAAAGGGLAAARLRH